MRIIQHLSSSGLIIALSLVLGSFRLATSRQQPIGQFDGQGNLGNVARPGKASYDPILQQYRLEGSGDNMWFGHDQGYYVWKKMSGNFILRADVEFLGKGVEPHRKIGWMIRTSLDSSSAQVSAVIHGNGLTSLQFRRTSGANTEEIQFGMLSATVVQLERKDGRYIMSVARFGDTLVSRELDTIDLGDQVYVGLFICSHNPRVTEKADFRNVRIIVPASESFIPYHDYIGSNLEILDTRTGLRKIIYRYKGSFQAPNWSKDGKYLVFNQDGLLYRYPLPGGPPVLIPTGFAIGNNNDHVISFNGRMLAISNQGHGAGGSSLVYTVPIEGGSPHRLTTRGPSYAHGWSPDGRYIVFTGQRNGNFDIYRKAVSGGHELRLTDAPGLDDGPEYTPDGKYIYFNSERTGIMQIWRMKADGSDQEQVTHDGFNDWFPHISPNGKWIVFISFSAAVRPDDHPFYKHVYIRLMPVNGGTPRVIAYVYGGQGTMNTPDWSPDSRHISFVSNSADIR